MSDASNYICPSEEELFHDVQRNMLCPVHSCGRVLAHSSALRMHLIKAHRILKDEVETGMFHGKKVCRADKEKTEPPAKGKYQCPILHCVYARGSYRFFTGLRNLRQHYMRAHAVKKYKCSRCGFGFGLERDMVRHERECGLMWICGTCGIEYTSRISLESHCRRLQHEIPEHYQLLKSRKDKTKHQIKKDQEHSVGKSRKEKSKLLGKDDGDEQTSSADDEEKKKPTFILPRPTAVIVPLRLQVNQLGGLQAPGSAQTPGVIFISDPYAPYRVQPPRTSVFKPLAPKPSLDSLVQANSDSGKDIETQTEKRNRKISVNAEKYTLGMPMVSIGTQTVVPGSSRKRRSVAGTQTTGEYILQCAMKTAKIPLSKESRASQVSPRARLKRAINTITQSCETQTLFPQTVIKKRKVIGSPVSRGSDNISDFSDRHQHKEVVVDRLDGTSTIYAPHSTMYNLNCASSINSQISACSDSLNAIASNEIQNIVINADDSFGHMNQQSFNDGSSLSVITDTIQDMTHIQTQTTVGADDIQDMSHTQTQTTDLWHDLQAFGESTSTQTFESLMTPVDDERAGVSTLHQVSVVASSSSLLYTSDPPLSSTSTFTQDFNMDYDDPAHVRDPVLSSSLCDVSTSTHAIQTDGLSTFDSGMLYSTGIQTDTTLLTTSGQQTDLTLSLDHFDLLSTPSCQTMSLSEDFGTSIDPLTFDPDNIMSIHTQTLPSSVDLLLPQTSMAVNVSKSMDQGIQATTSEASTSLTCQSSSQTATRSFRDASISCRIQPMPSDSMHDAAVQMDQVARGVETQTNLEDIETLLTGVSSQTVDFDTEDMETQTMEDMFDQLISNMQTQTHDDFFRDLNLVDIETQTQRSATQDRNLDLSTVETQTVSHSLLPTPSSLVQLSNIETQTLFPTLDLPPPQSLSSIETQTSWHHIDDWD